MWAWLIFKVCDRLKKTPIEISNCTLRELDFLVTRIIDTEVQERVERMNLAGLDGNSLLEQYELNKNMNQLTSTKQEEEDKLLKLTTELHKGMNNGDNR